MITHDSVFPDWNTTRSSKNNNKNFIFPISGRWWNGLRGDQVIKTCWQQSLRGITVRRSDAHTRSRSGECGGRAHKRSLNPVTPERISPLRWFPQSSPAGEPASHLDDASRFSDRILTGWLHEIPVSRSIERFPSERVNFDRIRIEKKGKK